MTIYITLLNSIIDIWVSFRSWNPTWSTENWYSSITRSSVFLSVFTRNVQGKKIFFQECPYFDEGGRGEIKLKISLFKMSLFMVGGGRGRLKKGQCPEFYSFFWRSSLRKIIKWGQHAIFSVLRFTCCYEPIIYY